ncbi:hypothetical protein Nepgr_016017 [Nepenthes gracilis]|uniref:Disease resistance N-terminal domain-containing protein n=1 Tax=Nepenthes gracilis TaxID=150966 RepID=A0AAD3XRV1_NEPGR|nr:hypothetical protein Nepgr_016017 [Nepenthes gracilis]
MVDAITATAAEWISSQLVDEAKFLYGVEDQMLKLQIDLKCMQQYIQDAEETQLDEKGNDQVTIFTETIREIAFRAEDVIDTYILKVGSDKVLEGLQAPVINRSHEEESLKAMHMLRRSISLDWMTILKI